ncbi:hypothetical protein [Streptomyces virginiae]|uniref:Uncharacterized protein n=1 Tax=Streptomyces virginiae TaxID=1961 RepID=A0ABZ1TQY5_STRVG|nr:hypothetical protein [Streptomyces virginiae]
MALANRFWAGVILFFFGVFRWILPAVQGEARAWTAMCSHVKSEIFFHCVAIAATAIGAALVISGYRRTGFVFATRAVLAATLLLAALIAVNKSTTRARKVCTEIYARIKSVEVLQKGLFENLASPADMGDEGILNRRLALMAEIQCLDRALRTGINSGYPRVGSPILPSGDRRHLIYALTYCARANRGVRADAVEKWGEASQELNDIAAACKSFIDTAA